MVCLFALGVNVECARVSTHTRIMHAGGKARTTGLGHSTRQHEMSPLSQHSERTWYDGQASPLLMLSIPPQRLTIWRCIARCTTASGKYLRDVVVGRNNRGRQRTQPSAMRAPVCNDPTTPIQSGLASLKFVSCQSSSQLTGATGERTDNVHETETKFRVTSP